MFGSNFQSSGFQINEMFQVRKNKNIIIIVTSNPTEQCHFNYSKANVSNKQYNLVYEVQLTFPKVCNNTRIDLHNTQCLLIRVLTVF